MPEFLARYSKTIYRYCKRCDKAFSKRELEAAYFEENNQHVFGENITVCPACKSDWAEARITN